MTHNWRVVVAAAAGIVVGVSVTLLHSQDRAAVVPGMKVLLENARVRVQFHDVAVGQTVPMHSHPCYVAYVIAPYKAKLKLAGGSEKLVDRQPGDVFWGDPVMHSVENLGTSGIHNLIVELKNCGEE
jgi:quercetin dioxygenase-like cupin family protein